MHLCWDSIKHKIFDYRKQIDFKLYLLAIKMPLAFIQCCYKKALKQNKSERTPNYSKKKKWKQKN